MHSRVAAIAIVLALAASHASAQSRPNVILIYADDLGYGDVSAYGARRLKTPNIDRLAREGLRFTDGHSPAATCTPSRYAMLTGEYAWRKPGTGILPGNAALIIEPGRTTLASVFQRAGYATGVVGKWHLGLGPAGGPDWNAEIRPGPTDIGFDYAFVMAATGDRVPTVYVENRDVVGLDRADPIRVSYGQPIEGTATGRENPDLLKIRPSHGHDQTIVNGISRIGYMTGGRAALWKDEDMADVFTRKAVAFIEQRRGNPFFLFFALHDPHVPRVPHARFVGATSMGPRGDAIAQLDWSVGEVLSTLDRLGIASDTLVLFTSDNGPVVDDGYRDEAAETLGDHVPAGPFRGGKYSNFEAGTRVPFVLRWPARVTPGVSTALVSQVDFIASFAALVNQRLSDRGSPDSRNVLQALLGTSTTGRVELVEQAGSLSLRQGRWKYIAPGRGPRIDQYTKTELGNDPRPQLYDLAADEGERNNLATTHPETLQEMAARLDEIRRSNGQPATIKRPNIFLAIADDWSFPHAGVYGDRTVSTPNFDRIAREGARFTHAFVAAPSCTPSRAALLTGQAIHRLEAGATCTGFFRNRTRVGGDHVLRRREIGRVGLEVEFALERKPAGKALRGSRIHERPVRVLPAQEAPRIERLVDEVAEEDVVLRLEDPRVVVLLHLLVSELRADLHEPGEARARREGGRRLAAPTRSRFPVEIVARLLLVQREAGQVLVQRIGLHVVGIDGRRRHVRREVDVLDHEVRVVFVGPVVVGVRARHPVIEHAGAGEDVLAAAREQDALRLEPVLQVPLDLVVADGVEQLAPVLVVAEGVRHAAQKEIAAAGRTKIEREVHPGPLAELLSDSRRTIASATSSTVISSTNQARAVHRRR